MPKIHDTRKHKALKLIELCTNGPEFHAFNHETFTPEEARRRFRLWSETYVVPLLEDLVPELRKRSRFDV